MKSESANAEVESAFGFSASKLPDMTPDPKTGKSKYEGFTGFPLKYSYDYKVFENAQEAIDAGYSFIKLANTAEKNAAKAKEYQKAISVLKPDQNDPLEVRKRLIRDIMALGKTEAQAEALVDSMA